MSASSQTNPANGPGRRHCILGTAGHIDHGKSALVKILTGTDPDRLPEEQVRGMTIVLGFAHLSVPNPQAGGEAIDIGIVDVPGHEKFVRTMVAGATGIDLGLLVVAADDGVMPQTREHVEILDLLGVETGLVAITKADVVDGDRISAVRREIGALVSSTTLRGWPVVATSTKSGEGLDEVCSTLGELAVGLPAREESSVFRLAIDRVFAIRGRGTVVTGSVLQGRASAGQALELHPAGVACKVREVQSHGASVGGVGASQRGALNLTGIDRDRLGRGMVLATPGYLAASRHVDVRMRVLARREKPLPSHRRVRVSMGTSDTFAVAVVVGGRQIEPGADALVQLRFEEPNVAAYGQRFIIRTQSAQATIGGGVVVRPVSRRIRASHREEIEALKRAESDDPFVRYTEAVRRSGFDIPGKKRLACETGVRPEDIPTLEKRLEAQEAMISIGSGRRVHRATVEGIEHRALGYVRRHHAIHPTEPGVLRDRFVGWIEKRSAPGCGKLICERLESSGGVVRKGPYLAHREFGSALSPEDSALLAQLVSEITAAGFDVPAWPALRTTSALSKQRSKMLEDLARCEARLVSIAPQRYVSVEAVAGLKETVHGLGRDRPFKLAEVRDALKLSRRVVQPLLEYLDRIGFTKRVGDERVLL